MATSKLASNRVSKPIVKPSYTTTSNAAPVPQQQAAPPPVAAAAPGVSAGKVQGPWDKFRAQKPEDIPQEWWDQYIDTQNSSYQRLPDDGSKQQAEKIAANYSPQQFADTARQQTPAGQRSVGGALAPTTTAAQAQAVAKSRGLTQQTVDLATKNAADNKAFIDTQVMPRLTRQDNAGAAAGALDQQALQQQTQSRDNARDQLNNLVGQQSTLASGYNADRNKIVDNYTQQQGALNTQDQAGLTRYMSETDPLMNQLQARGWGADVQNDPEGLAAQRSALGMAQGAAGGSLDYAAAQAQSNAADVARQENAYSQFQNIGAGQLDYTAAQYKSNTGDVNRQLNSYDDFNAIGGGKLDYQSQAAKAYANPEDLQSQRDALAAIVKDRTTGDADQRDAYNTIKSRTGVEATAQEAYLAEQARRKFENDDSSRRSAMMEDMAQRGLRSGSAEIANMVSSQQQTAADRSIAEMGLQANAIGRAAQYTGMQADQANAMRGSQQNAMGLESNLSTDMRNAGFDEAYKRGVGADSASANNQSTRLTGYTAKGAMATDMRNASDAVGTFNVGQTNTAQANNQGTRLAGYQGAGTMATDMRDASDRMNISNAGFTNDAYANNQRTRSAGIDQSITGANNIRTANDAIATFNKTGSQTAQRYQDTYAQDERTRVGNLAGDRVNAGLNTTKQTGDRNDSTYQAGRDANDVNYARDRTTIADARGNVPTIYDMDTDVNNMTADVGERNYGRIGKSLTAATNIAGTRSGQATGDLDTIIRTLQGQKGDIEAERAEDFY